MNGQEGKLEKCSSIFITIGGHLDERSNVSAAKLFVTKPLEIQPPFPNPDMCQP